ncbi:hypothetical protein NZNM25_01370 [Nitrosopumilus zosterae]|uniref:Uncharacterized protein n=1 Tax=Nitrosopumilus zosterae TaxID=718286 RepID=A0A2S2KNX8_9ARCH|nr:hypothetical protein [Nitrosopumilus zosterae]BDQ31133.1 hypothetical protein NZOSNM25_001243 [Nitrosopumilus zosterae]GBH33346.1 hypothetical protein NZNM25_01370 [Nitrosopumilus zosterae]
MTTITVVFAILAVALTTTIGITPAFADFQDYIWSRSAGDGHLGFLNCSGDNCDLKLKTTSGVQIHSQSTINSEVDSVVTEFDSVGKKMSIDRVTTADSIFVNPT